jgi:hypothetical protein
VSENSYFVVEWSRTSLVVSGQPVVSVVSAKMVQLERRLKVEPPVVEAVPVVVADQVVDDVAAVVVVVVAAAVAAVVAAAAVVRLVSS